MTISWGLVDFIELILTISWPAGFKKKENSQLLSMVKLLKGPGNPCAA